MSTRNRLALQVMRCLYRRIVQGEPPAVPPKRHRQFEGDVRHGELVEVGTLAGALLGSGDLRWFVPFTRFSIPVGTGEYKVSGDYGKGCRVLAVWCRRPVYMSWFRKHGELKGGVLDKADVDALKGFPDEFEGGVYVRSVKSIFTEALFDTLLSTHIAVEGGAGFEWLPSFKPLLRWLDSVTDYRPPKASVVPGLWSLNLGGGVNGHGYIQVYIEFLRDCYMSPIEDVVVRAIAHEHRHLQQRASGGALPHPAKYKALGGDDDAYASDPGELDAESFAFRAVDECPEEVKRSVKEEIITMEAYLRDLLQKCGGMNKECRCEAPQEFLKGADAPCPCEEAGEAGCPLAKEVANG